VISSRPLPASALSVVVPSRNTRELTLACLAAIDAAAAAQPGPGAIEVVVVDDGGDDGTAEAVGERFPAVRLLRCERQVGFTRAANRGLQAAAGDVLLLLNSDTEVAAGGEGLAALLALFAAEPRLGIAGAALRYPDGSPQWSGGGEPTAVWLFALASGLAELLGRLPLYRRLRPMSGTRRRRRGAGAAVAGGAGGAGGAEGGASGPGGARSGTGGAQSGAGGTQGVAGGMVEVAWVTGAAMAIRREAWAEVGPLDERFVFYAQDLDLCVRARRAGWMVAVVPAFEVVHHHGATILTEGGGRAGRGVQHPELLWTDLLHWAGKRGGAAAERRAARALAAGGWLRLAGRHLVAPLLPGARRSRFRAESAAFGRALAAVRRAPAPRAAAADGPCHGGNGPEPPEILVPRKP
jgi:N-acetylglucosaminyl-diphospho-decaprenol L-rhamnosyltransferase